MKRVWVAGVLSFCLATIPFATSFADDNISDTLTVNISESCTLTRDTTNDTSNDGTNGAGVYTDTLLPGTTTTFSNRQSVLLVSCNYNGGFSVGTRFEPLTRAGGGGSPIIYSDTTPSAGSGTWTASIVTTDGGSTTLSNISITGTDSLDTNIKLGTLMTSSAGNTVSNASYTIRYTVAASNSQVAGTYTGSATYTLSKNS